MAIFTRRRLQSMLDEIGHLITDEQARGLVNRMESKKIEQALPAEMELGLTWAIAQLGPVEIEPEWYSERRVPDLFTEHLFPEREAIVEITSLSDAELPSDKGMRNASRKLSQEAGAMRRGAGRHLSYYFFEEKAPVDGVHQRRVCVPPDLLVTDRMKSKLRQWIVGKDRRDGDKLQIHTTSLNVVITWNDKPQSRYNFWTSMPPEIWHLTENYVFRALEAKAKQLRNSHFKGIRCVILADVGSTALRQADKYDHLGRVFNGQQIVAEFLGGRREPGIDVVAILTPNRSRDGWASFNHKIDWKLGLCCRDGIHINTAGFDRLLEILPKPRREGYQSRQLHEQSVFSPTARGRYLGTNITGRKGDKTEIKFSARALLDLLAGRITPEQANSIINGTGSNALKVHLDKGETIAALRIEPGGPDSDDNHIVFEFSDDPAARPLLPPAASASAAISAVAGAGDHDIGPTQSID